MTMRKDYGMIKNTIIVYIVLSLEFYKEGNSMGKKGMEQNEVRKYLLIIGTFLIFMIGCLLFFLSWLQKDVEINSQKNVATNVERQSYHLNSIIDIQFSYLSGMATYVGERENIFSGENKRLIQSIVKEQDLDLLALIDADGNAYYSNGARKSVKTRNYFNDVMEGKRVMSRPVESMVDGKTKVILAVPIYKDGEIMGALGASYNVGALNQMLFNDIYDGVGFSMIIDSSGRIISCDSGKAYRNINISDNVYDFYVTNKEVSKKDMAETKRNIKNQKAGILVLKEGKKVRYLAYDTLGINDWMLCYVIPQSKAQESYQFVQDRQVILVFVIGGGMIAFLLIILYRESQKQKYMKELASIDGLTQLHNKIGTENLVTEWLDSKESKSGGVLLMLDVDHFKQINDNFGHAVGDRVLYKVGHLLKSSFREDDIIGRVGGDEFLIFMKGVTSEEFVIRRMESLIQYFHELPVEEIKDHRLTCSIGVAFMPKDGITFNSLYRNADEAMYRTKRNGRDGFSIYHKV